MKRKRLLVLLTMILALSTVLAACGNNTENNSKAGNSGNGETATEQVLRINLSAEPPTFDPAQAQDSQANTVLKLMYEGLTRMDDSGEQVPGVASEWEVSPDGLQYVFKLRQDAKWSNGDPVTANDFVFAWERALNPAAAAPYAYQLYYLKNAEAYNTEEITDFSQVGVKATDDYTLEVTLENPAPYFLSLTSFYTYYPVHKSVEGNEAWATSKDTMIVNGPFTMTDWTTGQKIEVTKNENYWDKDNIKLSQISMSLVNSGASELLSYKNGELHYAGKPNGEIPTDQIEAVKKELADEYDAPGIASTYYYEFNVTEEPFDNAKIRKAFAMAVNRKDIVEKVTMGGQIPAYGFVAPGIKGENDEYRTEFPDTYFEENLEEAKKLLAEGMAEKGYTTMPEITLIYNSSETHKKVALAIADMWQKNLGVTVKMENQEWGVFLENRQNLNYQVARAGWSSDYNDPMSFMDMWITGGGNNDAGFSNAEYDALIKEAYQTQDNAARMAAMSKAEKILIEDEQVLMPLFYYTNEYLIKPNLKGVFLDFSGAVDFSRAYFE